MKSKLYKGVDELVEKFIKDNDTLVIAGFGLATIGEEIHESVEKHFLETGHPNHLGVISGGGNVSLHHYAHEGMVDRVLVGHYGSAQNMCALVSANKCQSWNIPQGMIGHVLRAGAMGNDFLITKVGLGTYVDPRLEGAKMNSVTTEEIVSLTTIDGEEYLKYKVPKIDVCILRATTADEFGNVSFKDEMYLSWTRAAAMCCAAQGGKVIVVCKNYVQHGQIPPKEVAIPGTIVDGIAVTKNEHKYFMNTVLVERSDAFIGNVRVPLDNIDFTKPLDERKIIGRRGALELVPNAVVNIGIGIPEAVSAVAGEEGCIEDLILSVEAGVIGGAAAPGEKFGTQVNAECIWEESTQFDYYHAGLLNVTYLGLAQVNMKGDVNVSKFKPDLVTGSGGFIDIVHKTPVVCFCGSFTAGGLAIHCEDGKLIIDQEGKTNKFRNNLIQTTFSGDMARLKGQKVMFITERAVFKLTDKGLLLTEIAPGIDLEKDILAHMEFKPLISEDLKLMDERLFKPELIGLKAVLDAKRV